MDIMKPEYRAIIDKHNLIYKDNVLGIRSDGFCWNGFLLLTHYGDAEYGSWAFMTKVNARYINTMPFTSLECCRPYTPEELDETISRMIMEYKKTKERIKLKKMKKDFK